MSPWKPFSLIDEDELVVVGLVDRRDGGRQRLRVVRVAEREVVRLDGEDVGEVVPDLEREVEGDAALARGSRRPGAPASSRR